MRGPVPINNLCVIFILIFQRNINGLNQIHITCATYHIHNTCPSNSDMCALQRQQIQPVFHQKIHFTEIESLDGRYRLRCQFHKRPRQTHTAFLDRLLLFVANLFGERTRKRGRAFTNLKSDHHLSLTENTQLTIVPSNNYLCFGYQSDSQRQHKVCQISYWKKKCTILCATPPELQVDAGLGSMLSLQICLRKKSNWMPN